MRYRAFRMAPLASCLYQRSVPLAELTADGTIQSIIEKYIPAEG